MGAEDAAETEACEVVAAGVDGCRQGTGTACLGVADPNCRGDEGRPLQGEGVAKGE